MKAFGILLLSAALCALLVACGGGPTSVEYEMADGRFAMTFPGKPEVTTKDKKQGAVTLSTESVTYKSGKANYTMFRFTYPAELKKTFNAKQQVRDMTKGSIRGMTILEEHELNVGGLPGYEIKAKTKEGMTCTMRAYASDEDVSIIQTMVLGMIVDEASVNSFLDSFEVR